MKKNQPAQGTQSVATQLSALLEEANGVMREIEAAGINNKAALDDIERGIDESITAVEKIFSDLDQMETEAGDELDKLILGQAEALAEE